MAELSTNKKEKCLEPMSGIEPWTPILQTYCAIRPATKAMIICHENSLTGCVQNCQSFNYYNHLFHHNIRKMKAITKGQKINCLSKKQIFQAHNFKSFCDNRATDSTEKSQPDNRQQSSAKLFACQIICSPLACPIFFSCQIVGSFKHSKYS